MLRGLKFKIIRIVTKKKKYIAKILLLTTIHITQIKNGLKLRARLNLNLLKLELKS